MSNDEAKNVNPPVEFFEPQMDQPPVELSPKPLTAPVTLQSQESGTEISTDVAVPDEPVKSDGMPGGREPAKREIPSKA